MAESVYCWVKSFFWLILHSGICWNSVSSLDSDGIFIDSYDVKKPTIQAARNFNVSAVTRNLRHAMEGYGTNENKLISILTSIDFHQRKEVEAHYKRLFKRNLRKDLENELSGSFQSLILSLIETPEKILSDHLNIAMKGWGTDEDCLTEILCCHNSDDISRIAKEYKSKYKNTLEEAVHSETSGKYRTLLHKLLTRPRKSGQPTPEITDKIAQNFVRSGFGKSGQQGDTLLTEELTSDSFQQLHLAMNKFREIIGSTLESTLKEGFSAGDFGKSLLRIVECTENRPRAYAKRLNEAFGRFRNNDNTLIRIIALRSSIDLESIKSEYKKMYKDTLENSISKGTRGDLRTGLLALINGPTRV